MPEIRLAGTAPEPLGSYLKAVGLLRLLGAQIDSGTTARWRGDHLLLDTPLTEDELIDFVVDRYVPTPIITPWNSGSGFGADDAQKSKSAFAAVATIAASTEPRLELYRRSIAAARLLVGRADWALLDKQQQVALCRNTFPDEAVDWIDAAVVLTSDSRAFPPLLGTGGNDGRLDFGSNVMQRLVDVMGVGNKPRPARVLRELAANSLFDAAVRLDDDAPGQFDPLGAGGPNSSPFGNAKPLSNPFNFLLAFEGAIAFASGVGRKLGAGSGGVSAVPFTVAASAVAYASAADESTRGEFWAPLWAHPVTARELLRLIGEARADYRGRHVRNGADFARSLATFGVDRGISQFVRFGFLERNGLATLCVPLGRKTPTSSPAAAVVGQLDRWLNGVRRSANRPASADALLRAIDRHQFMLDSNDPSATLFDLLHDVAQLDRLASRSNGLRQATQSPVTGARAADWLPLLDDGSDEFAVACALASFRPQKSATGFIRQLVNDLQWNGRPAAVDGFGTRPLVNVLADCLVEISQEPERATRNASDPVPWCGPCAAGWCNPVAFARFARQELNEARIERMLAGLMLLDWRQVDWRRLQAPAGVEGVRTRAPDVSAAVSLLKPLFAQEPVASRRNAGQAVRADPTVPRLLASNRVEEALQAAVRTLRIEHIAPLLNDTRSAALHHDGRRLAATALVPVSPRYAEVLLGNISEPSTSTPSPPSESEQTQ